MRPLSYWPGRSESVVRTINSQSLYQKNLDWKLIYTLKGWNNVGMVLGCWELNLTFPGKTPPGPPAPASNPPGCPIGVSPWLRGTPRSSTWDCKNKNPSCRGGCGGVEVVNSEDSVNVKNDTILDLTTDTRASPPHDLNDLRFVWNLQCDFHRHNGGHINHFQVIIFHLKPGYPGYPVGQATILTYFGSLTPWVPWVPRLEMRDYDLEMVYMTS